MLRSSHFVLAFDDGRKTEETMAEVEVTRLREAFGRMAAQMSDALNRSMKEVVEAMSKADVRVITEAEAAPEEEAGFMSSRVIRVRGCTPLQSLAKQVRCSDCDWATGRDGSPHVTCRRFGFKTDLRRPARETGHQNSCAAFISSRPRSCLGCAFFRHDPKQYSPEQGFCDLHMVAPMLDRAGRQYSTVVHLTELGTAPCVHWRPKPPKVCAACRHAARNDNGWWACQKTKTGDGLPLMIIGPEGMWCEQGFEPDLQAIASREFQNEETWSMSWLDYVDVESSADDPTIYDDDVTF